MYVYCACMHIRIVLVAVTWSLGVCVRFSFNFSSAARELEAETARNDSTDGNPATSQSGLSSFAHSIKKPAATPSDKVGKPVRQAKPAGTSKKKKRSRASATRPNTHSEGQSSGSEPSYMYTCTLLCILLYSQKRLWAQFDAFRGENYCGLPIGNVA